MPSPNHKAQNWHSHSCPTTALKAASTPGTRFLRNILNATFHLIPTITGVILNNCLKVIFSP